MKLMGLKGWDTPCVRQAFTGAFDPRAPMAVGETLGQWTARVQATIKKRQERAEIDKLQYEKELLEAEVKLAWETSRANRSVAIVERMMRRREETKFKRRLKGMKTRTRYFRMAITNKDTEIKKLKKQMRNLKKDVKKKDLKKKGTKK